jgi:hypothetical protein
MSFAKVVSPTALAAARDLASYAKAFGAGAFGSPLARDIDPATVVTDGETTAIVARQDRPSLRRDWTGRRYTIPAGVSVARNVARRDVTVDPPHWLVERPDYLITYVEDRPLTTALRARGRPVIATRISAAAELISVWGPVGTRPHTEALIDWPTAEQVGVCWFRDVPFDVRNQIVGYELEQLSGWHDDYPYYSDGSWSSLSLRGFDRDPRWGVKPSEMPKKWQAEHPEAMAKPLQWTTLGDQAFAMRALIDSLTWLGEVERVRLMRMAGQPGKITALARHSDITDRNAGTRPGQIARFHLPLVSHPAITMSTWELDGTHRSRHLEPWKLYYLDQRKPHAVSNPTSAERIHLVIDAVVDRNVSKVIESLA